MVTVSSEYSGRIVDVSQLPFHSLDIVIGLAYLLFGKSAIAQTSGELPLFDGEGHERRVSFDAVQKVEILLTDIHNVVVVDDVVVTVDANTNFAAA